MENKIKKFTEFVNESLFHRRELEIKALETAIRKLLTAEVMGTAVLIQFTDNNEYWVGSDITLNDVSWIYRDREYNILFSMENFDLELENPENPTQNDIEMIKDLIEYR